MSKAGPPRRLHPLAELVRVRLLEFVREPEGVFWVFVFPIGRRSPWASPFGTRRPNPLP